MVATMFHSRKTSLAILLLPFLLSFLAPAVSSAYSANLEEDEGKTPQETWEGIDDGLYLSCEEMEGQTQCEYVFPWGGDEILQFKEYHTYETMKARMMRLAQDNPDIFEFHEGLNGGINARGEETSADTYEGWHYGYASPWLKICLLYTSPSPRDATLSRMPSSA